MLVDSHCHLNFIDLAEFNQHLDQVLKTAKDNKVERFLSVCVELADMPALEAIANKYDSVYISTGVHPNTEMEHEVQESTLLQYAKNPKCIAIGETGLDYYRVVEEAQQELQRERFRVHIRAALNSKKPLIIHTRQAARDTLAVMKDESASDIGGVMHCFAEDLDVAYQAMDLNFYISLSGIVTFKNAVALQEVARKIPLDRILIETDAPYLAPVPFRGKQNHPALVRYVAEYLAQLRGLSFEEIAQITTENFQRCFRLVS